MGNEIRTFLVVWFGQLVSLLGSRLTGFAIGVWMFQETRSVTRFALISACLIIPEVLLSPFAGAIVDRYDRKWMMIMSDCGAAFCTLLIAVLFLTNQLHRGYIYLILAASSIFDAFQGPAYTASVALLVPKQQLGRANGMTQFGMALSQIIAPTLGGILFMTIQIGGVLLIDAATFLFAIGTLLCVHIPRPKTSAESRAVRGHLLREAHYGWQYIAARPGLLGLVLFFAFVNFTLGIVLTLMTPLVLSFASAAALGTIMSIGGVGMLLGSLLMSVWGGSTRRVFSILGFTLIQGLLLFLGGLEPSVPLIATAAFIFLFSEPLIIGNEEVIWQSKVAPDVLGRTLAIRNMISISALPLAALAAGPLADDIFEPLLAVNGPLAESVGRVIGVGPGRGIGLLFIVMGGLTVLITVVAFLYPRLRLVENELPDLISESSSNRGLDQDGA